MREMSLAQEHNVPGQSLHLDLDPEMSILTMRPLQLKESSSQYLNVLSTLSQTNTLVW